MEQTGGAHAKGFRQGRDDGCIRQTAGALPLGDSLGADVDALRQGGLGQAQLLAALTDEQRDGLLHGGHLLMAGYHGLRAASTYAP